MLHVQWLVGRNGYQTFGCMRGEKNSLDRALLTIKMLFRLFQLICNTKWIINPKLKTPPSTSFLACKENTFIRCLTKVYFMFICSFIFHSASLNLVISVLIMANRNRLSFQLSVSNGCEYQPHSKVHIRSEIKHSTYLVTL